MTTQKEVYDEARRRLLPQRPTLEQIRDAELEAAREATAWARAQPRPAPPERRGMSTGVMAPKLAEQRATAAVVWVWGVDGKRRQMDASRYRELHARVRADRGRASDFSCRCGAEAAHWANRTGDYESVSDYQPMCRDCHRRWDGLRAGGGSPLRPY